MQLSRGADVRPLHRSIWAGCGKQVQSDCHRQFSRPISWPITRRRTLAAVPEMKARASQVEVPFSKRVRSAVGRWSLQFNVGRRWSRAVENPAKPDPALPVRLFAIVATWCEEDIIEATVHNALTQGC